MPPLLDYPNHFARIWLLAGGAGAQPVSGFYAVDWSGAWTNIGIDVYNLLNANPVLTYNQTYSPTATTWLTPTSVLAARFMKFSANIDF